MSVCPEVFGKTDDGLKIDRDKCRRCGKCAEGCLGEAIVLSARKMTVDEVFDEIYADRSYYKYSGGGVTFSGGECLKQHTFLKELLIKCREAQINTCVESCLNVSWDIIDEISDYVDSFFADIKLMDTMKHKEYTGVSNEMIFDNIRKLSRKHRDITFRIPLIPGVNDDDENLIDTVKFVQSLDERLDKRIELLRYNDLAEAKYESIQKEFTSFGTFQTYEEIEERVCLMNKAGDNVKTFYCKH